MASDAGPQQRPRLQHAEDAEPLLHSVTIPPDDKVWFRRLGDIPGVQWTTPSDVDRTSIPGHDAEPQEQDWDSEYNYWSYRDPGTGEEYSSTATPAVEMRRRDESRSRTIAEELRDLAETLELPGSPSDYHFIIAESAEYLWRIRAREPAALREMRRLCLIDLDLLRARPQIIAPYHEDEGPLRVVVFDLLYRLHLQAGELAEAQEIAEEAAREFGQMHFARQAAEARERRLALEAEDA